MSRHRRPEPILGRYVRGRTVGTDRPVMGWSWACPLTPHVVPGGVLGVADTQRAAIAAYAAHYKAAHPRSPRAPAMPKYARLDVFPGITLEDAKAWLRYEVDGGAHCPCCQQVAKVYRRQIHAAMAVKLIRFYRAFGTDWGQAAELFRAGRAGARDAGGDFAKLRYWSLVEESKETRADGGRAGWWRITGIGARYVQAQVRVPQYALIFDSRLLRHDGPGQTIEEALGTKFSYNELMGRPL